MTHIHRCSHDGVDQCIPDLDQCIPLGFITLIPSFNLTDLVDMCPDQCTWLISSHDRAREDLQQLLRALVAAANSLNDRHTKSLLKLVAVNLDATPLRIIVHIQVNQQRNTLFQQLDGQEQVTFNVGAVHDIHHEIQLVCQQVIDDDFLFRRTRIDTIGSRQVDNRDRPILVPGIAHFLIDSYARPVADFLPCSGQLIEYGGFTGIRITGKRYC